LLVVACCLLVASFFLLLKQGQEAVKQNCNSFFEHFKQKIAKRMDGVACWSSHQEQQWLLLFVVDCLLAGSRERAQGS
jgi:hypothetical protein